MTDNSVFVVRESFGTYGFCGPSWSQWNALEKDNEETRFTLLSPDGKCFAVGNSSVVNIFKTEDGRLWCTVRHRMLNAKLSPQCGYLIAWDNPNKNVDNYNIWSLNGEQGNEETKTGPAIVHSRKSSKLPEAQFSWDDKVYATLSNDGRIYFYETSDFNTPVAKTSQNAKISNFALSPGSSSVHFICYVKGGKDQGASTIKLCRYPNVDQVIAQRSSFQSERVDIKWNRRGNAALVTTMTDVDKTGGSYYGKTALEYLDIKGEACKVQLSGPDSDIIHASKWSPNSTEFCIIVGRMPNTRAALLNSKCEKIMEMDIAARNEIYFNPQGNIVLLCGLGNLPGTIEVWELKSHKKCIARFRSQNSTQVEWLNDGVHFTTATTAPRMQVDNGFKVWNFTGKSVFEWKAQKHLFGITSFVSYSDKPVFPESELEEHIKITAKKPSVLNADKAPAYIPIHKRKGNIGTPIPAKSQQLPQASSNDTGENDAGAAAGDRAKERKILNLQKRLLQIQKLKAERDSGKKLEQNQEIKILGEESLLEEIKTLKAS